MRKLVTIRIDPNVWRKARELDLNISRTCENALKREIQRIIEAKQKGNYELPSDRKAQLPFLVLRGGFEPPSAAREAAILDRAILPEPSNL